MRVCNKGRLREVVVSLLCAPMVVTVVFPTMSMTSWGEVPAESGISGHALNELVDLSADHVRSCLEKLHVMICEMQRVCSLVGNDSLECLRESQEMENNKLKALTDLIAQTEDAIRRKEGHVDIMKSMFSISNKVKIICNLFLMISGKVGKVHAFLFNWNGTLLHHMRFFYEDNLILKRYPDYKKALIIAPSTTLISTAFFSNNIVQDFQENFDDEVDERTSSKANESNDKEDVYDDEEMVQVNVLMALADVELAIGKNHARCGEWIDITMRKRLVREPIWHLDSGCSRSMTGVKSYMHKYMERPGPKFNDKQGTIFDASKEIVFIVHGRNDVYIYLACHRLLQMELASLPKPMKVLISYGTKVKGKKHAQYVKKTEAVRIAWYTHNISIIVKRRDKNPHDIFRERIPDGYFYVFRCPMFIHNHKDHLGKFVAKVGDGYFLGYSFVFKAFKVINTRRQQIEETYHVTFDESMEAIRFTNTSVYEIKINDSSRYPPDKYVNGDDPFRQWSRDQHIKLVNIIGKPTEDMLTISMVAKLTTASASECLFANFLSKIEPRKVSEALKHLGWVDAMQEELDQLYRNRVWTLVLFLNGKLVIGSKWMFRNKKDEHEIVIRDKARLVAHSYSQE
ncbi:retrovirus-related pol polyprotein from transposon TNT 1-94 [Tanacetum coccineum]